ncbi:hypothetical protein DJ021_03015 [Phenylobacterium hankyongense]|uniref:Terminase small subunit n=1 Tax=Phenylobacterium hankyongense TaxID=1813876 RepID=A0A328AXG1_9CAUL|nr:hypothetical protein [Phenylobacterium hankyongense]RAK58841.1 hypothetical protein DJ021_03015 [Phenylobacterium hankyongense]
MPHPDDKGRSPEHWWLPEMDHTAGAKPSAYHPRFAEVICARVAIGDTLREIVADRRMPSYATLFRWLQVHHDFAVRYQRTRDEVGARRIWMDQIERERRAEGTRIAIKLGRRRAWHGGPKSGYTPAKARAFCRRVAKGESVLSITSDPTTPSKRAIYKWLKREPAFRAMYVAAKREAVGWLAFEAEMTADRAEAGNLPKIKREVARLEARIGRIGAKKYRALPAD